MIVDNVSRSFLVNRSRVKSKSPKSNVSSVDCFALLVR